MSVEREYQKYLYQQEVEKTLIDKVMDRQDSERFKELIKKELLTREDFLEMQSLVAGLELKLLNMSDLDRVVIGKYFIRINETIDLAQRLFDYWEKIDKEKDIIMTPQTIIGFENAIKKSKKAIVSSIFVIQYMYRSSMSYKGFAFDKLTQQRIEYAYPQGYGQGVYSEQTDRKGVLGKILGR